MAESKIFPLLAPLPLQIVTATEAILWSAQPIKQTLTSKVMAPTTHDAVEEASGSRSRAERRRHRHEPAVTDHLSGAIQPEAEPSSQQGKRKAALEQSEGEGRKKKRKRTQKSHRKKAAASASTGAHASDSEASSTVSPPLRFPRMPNPDDFGGRDAPGYHAANDVYFDLVGKYHEKMSKFGKLLCPFVFNLQYFRRHALLNGFGKLVCPFVYYLQYSYRRILLNAAREIDMVKNWI